MPASSATDSCDECQQLRQDLGVSHKEMTEKIDRKLTKTGKVLLGLFGATFTAVTAVALPFIMPALRRICLPYVPATDRQVQNVMSFVTRSKHSKLIDLGSGDGRIVIEAAKLGVPSVGVELNSWLVWYSRLRAWRAGVRHNTIFLKQDLWKVDLKKYDHIVIFGVEQMMAELESKVDEELCADGRVIACRFHFPTRKPVRTQGAGIDRVWLYTS